MLSLTLSAVALLSLPALALGQQVPQSGQVEKSLEKKKDPEQTKPRPKIEITPRAEMTSPDDAKVNIKVEHLVISGNKSISESELFDAAGAPAGRVGRDMTLAELKQAARRITDYYRTQGFGLAWAYVPVQDVKNGVVELAVVEGRVDKILVSGNDYYDGDFIIDHVARLQKQNTLSLATLEKGLMVLNSYPGMSVRSTLRQGDAPGTTDLYLDVQDRFPIGFAIDFDNYGPRSTGEDRLGATLTAFNLFDLGHWVSLRGVTSLDRQKGDTTSGRLEYTVPFKDGTKLAAYGSLYNYRAKGPVAPLDPAGDGYVFGVSLTHPLLLTNTISVTSHLNFDWKSLRQELLGIENAQDDLRILSLGALLEYTDEFDGRWVIGGDIQQGLGHFLGGLKHNDPDASRQGADNGFTRLNLNVFRLQKFTPWLSLVAKVQSQYAFQQLVTSEQFALGGQDSVRGYAPFEYMGDRGVTLTAEARIGIPWLAEVRDPFIEGRSLADMLQIAAFMDTGWASRIEPLPGERRRLNLTGAGVGLRLFYPEWVSVRFDAAWPITQFDSASGRNVFYYVSVVLNLH